jgi:ZIP family zinc transporter
MDPTLTVLLYSSVAAGMAGLGPLPLAWRHRPPAAWIGWANALAAGLMLGAAYALTAVDSDHSAVVGTVGAVLGVVFVYSTHAASRTSDLELNRLDETSPEYGYKVLLINTLHSAPEGVAIGVAMVVSVPFGVFMALSIAVHNIPEATVLSAILASRGVKLLEAAGLAIVTNVGQILLAVFTYAIVEAAPGMLMWALGFAVGSLVYLVMVQLLPESYRQAGQTTIALVTIVSMGIVVLLGGAAP